MTINLKFAVNYSQPAVELYRERPGAFDLFKLPAWPDLVEKVSAELPCYVHFGLVASGLGGQVQDHETGSLVDPGLIRRTLARTGTPHVNLHLSPRADVAPAETGALIDNLVRDVQVLTGAFGPENVVVENDSGGFGVADAALQPEVIRAVIEKSGCRLLLDLAHARLAARILGMDVKDYLAGLPLDRIGEVHITGVQFLDEKWQARLRDSGLLNEHWLEKFRNVWMDHLPLTEEDWEYIEWSIGQIHAGAWSAPRIVSSEYGGVGSFFEAVMDREVIFEQVQRLEKIIHPE
jgi:hypothetical protein